MRYFAIIIATLLFVPGKSQNRKKIQQVERVFFQCIFPEPATFSGGTNSLHKFINDQFIQPDAVPDSSFSKKGVVEFIIDKDGKTDQFKIIDSVGYGCDEEVMRILKLTKWKAAQYEGKFVNEFKRQPYTFLFEKSDTTNSNTSPQLAPVCPPQMLLAKYVL